ncbi:39S ribosomal protein L22, mitochondrial-like [Salmo trutta]|uniref:39S ribosomal protein L22, mitochondrial-like n=1 Tax=Salmo trutta TaxID=8032 RepID=UPI0011310DDD|nr:39S ribosomal protein L22, mitochondrial-like [Salmo trutta]
MLLTLEVRGMTIDEAFAQLKFDKKGAKTMRPRRWQSIIKVEYKSNLYVVELFSKKGKYLKRIRFHGRGMFAIMDKVHCHYFVKLVEGLPSKVEQKTGCSSCTIIHAL